MSLVTVPGIVLQIVELCSGPSLQVQLGPIIAGGLVQEPQLQHLCPIRVCPERGPKHQQKCSACPLGTALLSAVQGHRVLEHIPAQKQEKRSKVISPADMMNKCKL